MPQSQLQAQPGLFLDPNPFTAPPGALALADNCVIRYGGILESRRGFENLIHPAPSNISVLSSFGGFPLAILNSGTEAAYLNGVTWHSMGTVSAPNGPVPLNQFFSAQMALYVTSGTGLQRTDQIGDALQLAGLIRPAPFTASSITFVNSSIGIPTGSAVAYSVLYQRQVGSLFDIVSPPGAPITALNSGSQAAPRLTVPLGPQLAAGDVVQIYRTVTAASGVPSNEFFLVQSFPVTGAMLAAGSFVFQDSIPDDNLGVSLYTNASEEGAAQENDAPPISGDVCQFMGYTIYANTVGYYSMALQLTVSGINVSGSSVVTSNGLQPGDKLTFNVGSNVTLVAGTDFATSTGDWDVPGYVIQSLADTINANVTLHAVFQASPILAENTVLLEAVSPAVAQWSLQFGSTQYAITTGNIVQQSSPTTTAEVIQSAGVPIIGQIINLQPVSTLDSNFPAGDYIINNTSLTDFFYTNPKSPPPSPATMSTHPYTWQNAYPWLAWNITGQVTTTPGLFMAQNSATPAGLAFSKYQQPEAVPLENTLTVGNPNYPIARVIPLRQSVLIFKQGDGIWQLTGTDPTNFTAVPYDLTTQIAEPWSAAAVADTVCFVSTKGPTGVNESGGVYPLAPNGFDCPIREEILSLLPNDNASLMIGVGYESEKLYILWTPTASGDTSNTQAWVFSLAQAAWTHWPISSTFSYVNPDDNKLYYTAGIQAWTERKNYADTDYQDANGSVTISAVNGNTITIGISDTIGVGDQITQGAATGWVLTVNGTTVTLIGVTGGPFFTGAADTAKAITCTGQYLPWAGAEGDVGVFHKFVEFTFNFRLLEAPFVTVTSSTDMDSDADQEVVYGRPTQTANVNVRAGFSRDKGSGVMLNAGFVHAAALCNFNLQAATLSALPTSTRTPENPAP